MRKVTRISYSKNLNFGKYNQLSEIATRLGRLRKEIWERFGSRNGVGLKEREIRDGWLAEKRKFDVPARLWKETLRDTFDDILLYRESAKVKVRKAIAKRTKCDSASLSSTDEEERKRLYTLLKYDRWMEDSYLKRMMRKYYKHGKTNVSNQIVLDTQCYTAFERPALERSEGQAWIKVMGLERGKRIAIPLNTNHLPKGMLRLILRNGIVEVHYAIDADECSTNPCGDKEIGIDKGYSEVFVDSDGEVHGERLGDLLSTESDYLKVKYQRRNKLKAIAVSREASVNSEAKSPLCAFKRGSADCFGSLATLSTNSSRPLLAACLTASARKVEALTSTTHTTKTKAILKSNLGRKKLDRRKRKHTKRVRDKVFKAVHSVVDKAKTIVCEDLSAPIKGNNSKNQKRRLSGWVKGLINKAVVSVSQRRGSALVFVNCAY